MKVVSILKVHNWNYLRTNFQLRTSFSISVWSWQLCVSLWFVFCLTWAALVRLSLTGTVINLATLYFTKNYPLSCSNFLRYFRWVFHTILALDWIAGFCLKSHFQLDEWKYWKKSKKERNNLLQMFWPVFLLIYVQKSPKCASRIFQIVIMLKN